MSDLKLTPQVLAMYLGCEVEYKLKPEFQRGNIAPIRQKFVGLCADYKDMFFTIKSDGLRDCPYFEDCEYVKPHPSPPVFNNHRRGGHTSCNKRTSIMLHTP